MKNKSSQLLQIISAPLLLTAALALVPSSISAADSNTASFARFHRELSGGAKTTVPNEWTAIDKVLPDLTFDGLPLGEVSHSLCEQFQDRFDVVLPTGAKPVVVRNGESPAAVERWADMGTVLRLKNVTAVQVFTAMNLQFETDKTPLHWDLVMNGNRPTAVLRVEDPPNPAELAAPTAPKESSQRKVYYIGDLLVGKDHAQDWGQLVDLLGNITDKAFGHPVTCQTHVAAELIVVTGLPEELELVGQTLEALKQKARAEAESKKTTYTGPEKKSP